MEKVILSNGVNEREFSKAQAEKLLSFPSGWTIPKSVSKLSDANINSTNTRKVKGTKKNTRSSKGDKPRTKD